MSDGTLLGERRSAEELKKRMEGVMIAMEYINDVDAELKNLRAFAVAILDRDRGDCIEGSDLQDIGVEYGLLEIHYPTEPCCDECICLAIGSESYFENRDVTCYRVAKSLKVPK